MQSKKKNCMYIIIAILAIAALLGFDQWTKHLAVVYLKDKPNIVLIQGVLELEYLENRGAAFGILQNQQWLFAILTVLFLGISFYVFWKVPKTSRYMPIFCVFIVLASGAIGNFIDRLREKYVVDFIYFNLINFPIFNVADIYLTLSVVTIFILILFVYKDEDYDMIFGKRSKDGV
ncbi:signal peptidase II [Blautia liquoris]|uniref:Lipoprotein signal peptidase n=2 Tax=Blautia liquoris TaxID=2779518 RepID=A0A7M2RKV7_9FIRM|nr:signal peptidase II [Blautia liquoris]